MNVNRKKNKNAFFIQFLDLYIDNYFINNVLGYHLCNDRI